MAKKIKTVDLSGYHPSLMDPKHRVEVFHDFYKRMANSGDCDPAVPILLQLADHWNLGMEQRAWMALIYSTCYCAGTTYVITQEFPSYKRLNINQMQKWWDENRLKLIFQSDRRYVKNMNWFIPIISAYTQNMGKNQMSTYEKLKGSTLGETYDKVYEFVKKMPYYGRFSIFLLTETLNALTSFKMRCETMPWKEATTPTEGLGHYINRDDIVERALNGKVSTTDCGILDKAMDNLCNTLQNQNPHLDVNYWDVETALCAYRKLFKGSRYLGYYIDRQQDEFTKLQKLNPSIDWDLMWHFREEYFHPVFLGELNGRKGLQKELYHYFQETGELN